MATASVELGKVSYNRELHGRCIRQESLTISGSEAELATAVTAAEVAAGVEMARISVDTVCYVAVGSAPDTTATAATNATTARRMIPAGFVFDTPIGIGDLVAVKAI
jgi:hypothetical protein